MTMYPDYDKSILSVANSILKYYGVNTYHNTLSELDDLLIKDYKNVVLLIFDGLGMNVLRKNLPKNSFFRNNVKMEISSVYPCTTTAAITTILSGKTPYEHGWLGYSCYFSEINKCIDLFTGHESGTKTPASNEHLPDKILGYDNILTQIEEASDGEVKTYYISPFSDYFADTVEGLCDHIKNLCTGDENKFMYAYHFQPDYDMHNLGTGSSNISEMLINYDKQIEKLVNSLSNTLFIVTADHGMYDISMKCIEGYPEINKMLLRHISMEPRCCSFYVKSEYMNTFAEEFTNTFKDSFTLYTHDAFLDSGLLGRGTPHKKTEKFVGDFVAVALSYCTME